MGEELGNGATATVCRRLGREGFGVAWGMRVSHSLLKGG